MAGAGKAVCPACKENFRFKKELRNHVENNHSTNIAKEEHFFSSFSDFEIWKRSIEKGQNVSYVQNQASKKLKSGERFYYECHRSGFQEVKLARKRKLKSLGSKKIDGICPSSIDVTVKNNEEVRVIFWRTHFGHENELEHLFLLPEMKFEIARKIRKGIPFQRILDDVRDTFDGEEVKRIHLLKRKDLHNIKKEFQLSVCAQLQKKDEDTSSMDLLLQRNNEDSGSSPFLFYFKNQNSVDPEGLLKDESIIQSNSDLNSTLKLHVSDQADMDVTSKELLLQGNSKADVSSPLILYFKNQNSKDPEILLKISDINQSNPNTNPISKLNGSEQLDATFMELMLQGDSEASVCSPVISDLKNQNSEVIEGLLPVNGNHQSNPDLNSILKVNVSKQLDQGDADATCMELMLQGNSEASMCSPVVFDLKNQNSKVPEGHLNVDGVNQSNPDLYSILELSVSDIPHQDDADATCIELMLRGNSEASVCSPGILDLKNQTSEIPEAIVKDNDINQSNPDLNTILNLNVHEQLHLDNSNATCMELMLQENNEASVCSPVILELKNQNPEVPERLLDVDSVNQSNHDFDCILNLSLMSEQIHQEDVDATSMGLMLQGNNEDTPALSILHFKNQDSDNPERLSEVDGINQSNPDFDSILNLSVMNEQLNQEHVDASRIDLMLQRNSKAIVSSEILNFKNQNSDPEGFFKVDGLNQSNPDFNSVLKQKFAMMSSYLDLHTVDQNAFEKINKWCDKTLNYFQHLIK